MKLGKIWLLITLVCALGMVACNDDDDIKVGGIKLNKNAVELGIGQKDTLTFTIEPTNAANKNVVWKSEDTKIATVVDGVVVAVAYGTTKVTATTTEGNLTATCNITVTINGEYSGILKAVKENGKEEVFAEDVLLKLENATATKVKITTQIDLDLSELGAGILSVPVTGELDVKRENDTYTISGLLPVKVEMLQQELSVEVSGVIKTDGSIDLKMELEGFIDWFEYNGTKNKQ